MMDHQIVDSAVELDAATQQILERLRSFKQSVTPEERKLLGIDEGALEAFADIENSQDVRAAIQEIIDGAIKNVPAFKQLVDEDLKTEPEGLSRTSRVVSNLLRHLQGILKPSAASAIRGDRQRQAQEIMLSTLRRHARTPKPAPEAPAFSKDFDPIKPNELQLFGLNADLLTPKKGKDAYGREITTYPIAELSNTKTREPILFFLNRLKKEQDGKNVTVKNEATKKMSDDMKKDLIYRLLRTIREYKMHERGDIGPEAKWLGNSDKELRQIADSLVEKSPAKEPVRYQHDMYAVYEDAQALLSTIRRVKERLAATDVGERMEELGDAVDSALPSPENIEDKVKEIQEEVARLGLNREEKNAALYVNPNSMSYQPMTDPSARIDIEKEIKKLQQKIKDKGPSEDLINEIQNKERTYRAIGTLAEKDTSKLNQLALQYMDLLNVYKERAQKNLSAKGTDVVSNMDELVRQVADLARKFSRISKEDFFRGRWNRAGGRMMRAPAPEQQPEEGELQAVPTKEPEGMPELKLAADIGSYANKVQKFRGAGPAAAVEFLREASSSGGLLDELEERILSIMEAKPGTSLNPSETDYTGNPLAGQGKSIDDVVKSINKIRTVVGKFKPELLFEGALSVLDWLADLPALIRAPKNAPKKASVSSVLRRLIPELIFKLAQTETDVEEDTPKGDTTHKEHIPAMYRSPTTYYKMTKEEWNALPENERKEKLEDWKKAVRKYVEQRADQETRHPGGRPRGPSTAPVKSTSPAGVFIYGERMTPLGKKYLENVFDEPTFVPEFIEAMEAEGLNRMLLEGSEQKKIGPGEVDTTLAKILAKGSKDLQGETLGNILGTKAMRFAEEERQIKKTREEMEDARRRVADLNKAIVESEKKDLPKLIRFAEFLRRPMEKVREHLEKMQPGDRDRSPVKTRMERLLNKIENQRQQGVYAVPGKKAPTVAPVQPANISSTNVLSELSEIMSRYDLHEKSSPEQKEKAEEYIRDKQDEAVKAWKGKKAAETVTPPSKMLREVLVTKKRLKDVANKVNSIDDEMQRAQQAKKFYEYALEQQRKQGDYVSAVIQPQLAADLKTLDRVESFLNSENAQQLSEQARAQAQSMLNALRTGLEKETKALEDIVAHVEERAKATRPYTEELQTVNEDLKDGEVQRLYEVAISPEMERGTEEYEGVKERQRQRQKDIGYMMDLPTFKRKMQILFTQYKQSPGLKPAPGEEKTTALPKARLEEARRKAVEDKQKIDEINRIQDARNRSLQLAHFYENLIKNTTQHKQELETAKKAVSLLEQVLELTEGMPSDISDEEKKEISAKLTPIMTDLLGVSPALAKDLQEKGKGLSQEEENKYIQRALEEEKKALSQFENVVKEDALHLSDYEQKAKQYAAQASPTAPVPDQPVPGVPGQPDKPVPYGSTTSVQAGQDVYGPQKSPYEIALDYGPQKSRYEIPLEFTRDIPRPKGYDVLEGFLTDAKEELRILEGLKMTGKEWEEIPEEVTEDIFNRIAQLERIIPAIAQYGDQMVEIDGTQVPLKEIVVKFEDMVDSYQDSTSKAIKQRDDSIERLKKLQQKLRQHEEFIDPDTGEYKDLTEAEKENMKKIFFKELYWDLDKYWSTKVGKNIDVFGERDTAWYDNVFRSFQTLGNVRSDRKLMSLLNKYKSETRGDFGDTINRDKIQELERRVEEIENRYAQLGEDPSRSPEIKKLSIIIPQLKKQREQQDKVFTEMAQAVQAQAHIGVQEAVVQAAGEKPETKSDLSAEEKKNVEEAAAALQAIESANEIPQPELVEEAENLMQQAEQKVKQEGAQAEKEAALRASPHYNQKILYGPVMQKKIAELLSKEL